MMTPEEQRMTPEEQRWYNLFRERADYWRSAMSRPRPMKSVMGRRARMEAADYELVCASKARTWEMAAKSLQYGNLIEDEGDPRGG